MMIPAPSPPRIGNGNRRVRFRFRYLRRKGKWSTRKMKTPDLLAACSKLRVTARMSLIQFRSANGIRLKNVRKGLPNPPEELADDVIGNLAQEFRLSKRMRVIGYLVDRDFYVIWIDPDHTFV